MAESAVGPRMRGLGRRPHFDERSRAYPVRAVTAMRKRSYTWAMPGDVVLDQGPEGSCVGHAWAHELLARPSPATGVDHRYAREHIYWEAQKIDPWPGGAYPGASPTYEGTAVLAGAHILKGLGAMAEYRWAFSLDEVISGVGYSGPAVLGLDWHEGMMDVDSSGFIHPSGGALGGHAILCRGVNLKAKRVLLHNSWGAWWGRNGTCFLSFDDLGALLAHGGESCFLVGRKVLAV